MLSYEKVKALLKKNDTIFYFSKCFHNRNLEEFRDMVINDRVMLPMDSYGDENTGKIVYRINIVRPRSGLCYIIHEVATALLFCERMGAIPYVRVDPNNLYHDEKLDSISDNVMDYFFEPMSKISEAEVRKSACVISSSYVQRQSLYEYSEDQHCTYCLTDDFLYKLAPIYKKYFTLNARAWELINSPLLQMCRSEKVLAVHVRGTDMLKGYNKHPIAVAIDKYVQEAAQAMETHGFDKIFLATDDENMLNAFRAAFGSKLYYYSDTLRSDNGCALHYQVNEVRDNHKFMLGIEVLRDVYTLAACSGFLSGLSNIPQLVTIIKKAKDEAFVYRKVLSNGVADVVKTFGKQSIKNHK